MTPAEQPSEFIRCVERAISFEPSIEMKRRLDKNRETFAQYVVRLLSYSCKTCLAPPGVPCSIQAATKSPGVQFHRARARAARCPVTKHFYEPELDDD